MRRCVVALVLASIPVLMMMQVIQAYRYAIVLEETERYEEMQEDKLEENKRLLAGIAVFSAPERVYEVGTGDLGLGEVDPEAMLHVYFPGDIEMGQ